jgi:hypothetical protein
MIAELLRSVNVRFYLEGAPTLPLSHMLAENETVIQSVRNLSLPCLNSRFKGTCYDN